jgi:hypothetical protein
MEKRIVTWDIPIERGTLQVCLYMPRVLSYVGGRQGCSLSENGDASWEGILRDWVCLNTVNRDGAATFSNQVQKVPAGEEQHKAMVWKIPMWQVRSWIIAAISRIDHEMLQRLRAEMDYRFAVCRVTKGEDIEHLWGMQNKLVEFLFLSICRMLPSIAPFKCTNILYCVRELWITPCIINYLLRKKL